MRQCGATALLATTWPLGHQRSMLTFKNRKTLIINIHLTNQVDNACFLATRAAQTMSVLRATICCKHYRLIKLIPQHPANKRKPGVAPLRASNVCDDGNFSSPKECALAPAPDRMLAYGGMSKGRLWRFFPSAEVFGTFCVKKYSKNDNKKNIQQQVKGKSYWRTQDWCLSPFLCHHKKHHSTFYVEPIKSSTLL